MRVCVCFAVLGVVLGAVPAAVAYQPKIDLDAVPAAATGGGETVIAWTANGVVQTSSRNPDGSFAAAAPVGRSLGNRSPLLAITATGEQVVVWQSGRTLRSAARAAGRGPWRLGRIAGDVQRFPEAHLLVGPGGRITLVWTNPVHAGAAPSLWFSVRLPGGVWSAPLLAAGLTRAGGIAAAIDGAGDIVVIYWATSDTGGAFSVDAVALPAGGASWSPPVTISGSDLFGNGLLTLSAGGARTFVASWFAGDLGGQPPPRTRTARLRLPGDWEAPLTLVAGGSLTPAGGTIEAAAVDAAGNALALVRDGNSLAALRLPASAGAWTRPIALGNAPGADLDAPPAIVFGDDGAATAAFVHMTASRNTLRVATASAGSDLWRGYDIDAAGAPSCPTLVANPFSNVSCPIWMKTAPVVAPPAPPSVVAIQEMRGALDVLTRASDGAPWSAPSAIPAVGKTQATLAPIAGEMTTVRLAVTCTLPPCRGVAVLRMRDGLQRVLGRFPFELARPGRASRRILLPRSLTKRLAHGARIWTRVTFTVHEGDGTSEQIRRPYLLSGPGRVRVSEAPCPWVCSPVAPAAFGG